MKLLIKRSIAYSYFRLVFCSQNSEPMLYLVTIKIQSIQKDCDIVIDKSEVKLHTAPSVIQTHITQKIQFRYA